MIIAHYLNHFPLTHIIKYYLKFFHFPLMFFFILSYSVHGHLFFMSNYQMILFLYQGIQQRFQFFIQ